MEALISDNITMYLEPAEQCKFPSETMKKIFSDGVGACQVSSITLLVCMK